MRVAYCGYVDTGKIVILPRNIFHEALLSDMADPENDSVSLLDLRTRMFEETRFRLLGDSMRIRYADGSSVALEIASLFDTDDNSFIRNADTQQVSRQPAGPAELAKAQFRGKFRSVAYTGVASEANIGAGRFHIFLY
jgi:hypothetical protein